MADRDYAYATTKTGLTELRERNGGTLVSVICKLYRKEIAMARKSRAHELKHDGYRLQIHVRDGRVRLYTINGANRGLIATLSLCGMPSH
jgi:hypothetical protein